MISCSNNGPKAQYELREGSTEDVIREYGEASQNDGYVYTGRVELHYYESGDWVSDGMHEMYDYPNGNKKYIKFGNDLMPVYDADEGDYYHKVQYQGVYYYY